MTSVTPGTVLAVPAVLTAFGAPPTHVTATVVQQNPGRRATRALAGLGAFWATAAAAVFIPVAHFVLVPTFLAAGVVTAAPRLREDRRLTGVRGACPRCGVEQSFEAHGRFVRERTIDCPSCHHHLVLRPESPSA
jgi:hypothetical protein